MSDELVPLLDELLERAGGGEEVEAFGVDRRETEITAYDGDVESVSSARTRGVGVRLLLEERLGYASTSDLSPGALVATLHAARANARAASPDPANVLPSPAPATAVPDLHDPRFGEMTVEGKVDLALELERTTRGADPRVRAVEAAVYGDTDRTVAIASTTGVRGSYRRADAWAYVDCIAEDGGSTSAAYGVDAAPAPGLLDVARVSAEAVERATRLLGGSKVSSRRIPVVLDPFATASLLAILAEALSATAVQMGRSALAGRLGDRVAGEHLDLVDDGTLVGGPATAPWDGEGVPTRRTPLIEQGVLTGWLHDTSTAARDGSVSTGNAVRHGFKAPPRVGNTNLFLRSGDHDPAALLAQVDEAFYCQEVMGTRSGANAASGEISLAATGVMIRDGGFGAPVREVTLATTLTDLLAGIVTIGTDLRFLPFESGRGGATVLVEEMTLGGA